MVGMRMRCFRLGLALLAMGLAGCGNEEDVYPPNEFYRVTVVNLTHNQMFSPFAVVVHTDGYTAWQVGETASLELERLAESGGAEPADRDGVGDDKWFTTEAEKDPAVAVTGVAANLIGGGGHVQLDISAAPGPDYRLTVATNLLYTNDGFTGVTGLDIGKLAVGESLSVYAQAYDAGTEENTETATTVPGFVDFEVDADGNLVLDAEGKPIQNNGFGFDPSRANDSNLITIHPGVITADEPLTLDAAGEAVKAVSDLDHSHRFQQPVAKIIVERIL